MRYSNRLLPFYTFFASNRSQMVERLSDALGKTNSSTSQLPEFVLTLGAFVGVKILRELKEMAFVRDRPYLVDHRWPPRRTRLLTLLWRGSACTSRNRHGGRIR
jgi:hypothetical protein